MRTPSKKLLLAHWNPDPQKVKLGCSYPFLYSICADLSHSGVRSLLFRLMKASLLKKTIRNGEVYFELTEVGRQQLVIDYPVCRARSRKQGNQWVFCLVISSTSRDVQYRDLRQRLEQHGFYHLNRGLFACPDDISEELRAYLTRYYGAAVLIVRSGEIVVGDIVNLIEKKMLEIDFNIDSSSVSREINSLLAKLNNKKSIDDQLKKHIFSVFALVEESATQFSFASRLFPKKRDEFLKMYELWQECVRVFQTLFNSAKREA